MNAKTTLVSDIREKVTNGDFSAWTGDNPDLWPVTGESGNDPECSQVGSGEGHGGTGTGLCNLYTSDGTLVSILHSLITGLIVGKKYQVSIDVNTVIAGGVKIDSNAWPVQNLTSVGTYSWSFVATITTCTLNIARLHGVGAVDVTFDNVSIKPVRQMKPV